MLVVLGQGRRRTSVCQKQLSVDTSAHMKVEYLKMESRQDQELGTMSRPYRHPLILRNHWNPMDICRNYSLLARPLVNLTRKGVEFFWGPDQEAAQEALKQEIINSPRSPPDRL